MEERRQRCPLAAHFHVGAAEIPDHRHAQTGRQCRAVAHLQCTAHARRVGQRLAVKTDQINVLVPRQRFSMGVLNHLRRGLNLGPLPAPQSGGDHPLFGIRIGPVATFAEPRDGDAIGRDHRRIHPVQ